MTARGEHDLLWQIEGRRKVWSEWVATLPMEMSGALAATPWPVLGELVLPHLRLAVDVRDQVPVEVVYTAEAWDQWLHALEELQGSLARRRFEAQRCSSAQHRRDTLSLFTSGLKMLPTRLPIARASAGDSNGRCMAPVTR
jgi:hypothetical protein